MEVVQRGTTRAYLCDVSLLSFREEKVWSKRARERVLKVGDLPPPFIVYDFACVIYVRA